MKNKGFTLIELLAVIVILAVIALIAVPIVLGIINDSRDESNKISVEMYAKSVKNALLLHEMNGVGDASGTFTAVDAYTIKNNKGVTLKLEYSGNEVICDNIKISSIGDVSVSGCRVAGELVDYSYGKTTTLKDVILSNYGGESNITAINDFSTSTSGLYKADDDLGTSYYFRGNVTNNYVQFGKWQESNVLYYIQGPGAYYDTLEDCENSEFVVDYGLVCDKIGGKKDDLMYWRIVRINGDGTIRLIYNGPGISENYAFNRNGTGDYIDSYLKGIIDNWYVKNLKSNYEKYIADEIFCNDRSYSAYERLEKNNQPSLNCLNKEDSHTVNDVKNGNGLLTNPVGLITADESFMGGSYLTSSSPFWTMTSALKFDSHPAFIYYVETSLTYLEGDGGGLLRSYDRPVINLKADVGFTGTGTILDPYVIVTE